MIATLIRAVIFLAAAPVVFLGAAWMIRETIHEWRHPLEETPAHAVKLDDEPWLNEGRRRWRG